MRNLLLTLALFPGLSLASAAGECSDWLLAVIDGQILPPAIREQILASAPGIEKRLVAAANATMGRGPFDKKRVVPMEDPLSSIFDARDEDPYDFNPLAAAYDSAESGGLRLSYETRDLTVLAINSVLDRNSYGAHSTQERRRQILGERPAEAIAVSVLLPVALQDKLAQRLSQPKFADIPRLFFAHHQVSPLQSVGLQEQATLARYLYIDPDSFGLTKWKHRSDWRNDRDDTRIDSNRFYLYGATQLGAYHAPMRYILAQLADQAFTQYEEAVFHLDAEFLVTLTGKETSTSAGIAFSTLQGEGAERAQRQKELGLWLTQMDEDYHTGTTRKSSPLTPENEARRELRELRKTEAGRAKLARLEAGLAEGESLINALIQKDERAGEKLGDLMDTEKTLEAIMSLTLVPAQRPYVDFTGEILNPSPGTYTFVRVDGKKITLIFE